MAWETRARGGRYYTRSRKVDGRVVREYVGGGAVGELAARLDARDRAGRRAERARLDVVKREAEAAGAALAELDAIGEALARGALLAAGYRRHHRGEWRKRRDQDQAREG